MSWSLEDLDGSNAWIVGHATTANCAKILIGDAISGVVCWPSDWTGPNWLRDQGLIEFGDLQPLPNPYENKLGAALEVQYTGSYYARAARDRYKPRGRRVTLTAKGRQRTVAQAGGKS